MSAAGWLLQCCGSWGAEVLAEACCCSAMSVLRQHGGSSFNLMSVALAALKLNKAGVYRASLTHHALDPLLGMQHDHRVRSHQR